MILIIGGAFQGKTDYAIKNYGLYPSDILNGETMGLSDFFGIKCISGFHLFIKRIIENGAEPLDAAREIIKKNPEIIIIMTEIGNGIVPLEKGERIWREKVGKTGCFLAENADTVVRLICGIPIKIKG